MISMIEKSAIGTGPAIGMTIGWDLARPRLKRLAGESSRYLDEGEKLVTPVAICTRGGRAVLFTGVGVFGVAMAILELLGNRIGESGAITAAFIASGALALVLVPLSWIVTRRHAVVLTDRRLLVFRRSGMFTGHIRDVFIAMPRSDVSTRFTSRLEWGGLSVEFAPATGMAPIRLDFWAVDRQIASGIHHTLATAAARAQGITG